MARLEADAVDTLGHVEGSRSGVAAAAIQAKPGLVVEPFTSAWTDAWDAFVWRARNGTLFHTRRFLSYHSPDRFHDASLICRQGHRLVAVLPAAAVDGAGEPVLVSHPGASYGGPVFDGLGVRGVTEAVERVVDWAAGHGFRQLSFLRITPESFRRTPCAELEFALHRAGFVVDRRELADDLPLGDWSRRGLEGTFSSSTVRAVRKAIKGGVQVRITDDYAAYWPILERTLAARHATQPTHRLDEIQRVRSLFPEHITLFGAYLGERLIAGVVVFACNPVACYTFYFAQEYEYQHLRPTDLLVARIADWAAARGFRTLHFGISTEDAGRVVNWGLFRFKEGFGAGGVLRDSYRLDL